MNRISSSAARAAFWFVILIGIVSLFADFSYEAARSINGQFMEMLGASAAVVGFTAGFGELVGYGLRFIFGYVADKTKRYWLNAIVGYAINLLAVPALALAGNWPLAAVLIVAERTGRAIRKPAVEAMLSYAGSHTGQGWAFGLHEALDQVGATLGPLVMALVLLLHGSYRTGYSLLLVSSVLALATVAVTRYYYPKPHALEKSGELKIEKFSRSYWWYMLAAACVAAGFADFSLVGYHFQQSAIISRDLIPVYYAAAMGVGAVGAPVLGRLFDKYGQATIIGSFLLSAFFAPLVFLGHGALTFAGMLLWGLGMAAQETLLKPLVAGIVSAGRRATAFGLFDTGFGVGWFAGSWLMGYLYSRSPHELVAFSVAMQLVALPIFWLTHRFRKTR